MSGFTKTLRSYRDGSLSKEDLLAEVERVLTAGEMDSGALLALLNNEQAKERLPGNIHIEIVRKLLRRREAATADSTEGHAALARELSAPSARAAPPPPGSPYGGREATSGSPSAVDDSATVFIDQAAGVVQRPPPGVQRRKPAISVGSVLHGRFRLIEPIGEGGMSTVYKAIDLRKVEARAPETHVAVKLLTAPLSDFTHSLTVLQGEAHKLQRLPHPNIVRVIDCDRDGRTVFMTMEYLSGESLKRKISAPDFKGMPPKEAVAIIESIANGLAFAHRNGIMHGDLKPGNVIITDSGEVKIIDFGIARFMTRDGSTPTVAGDERPKMSALTPPYASPQMLENDTPDPRDDIYGLACLAHELLTGRHPFDRRVANEARDSGLKLLRRPSMSSAQYRAIAHGLEFDRDRRTASAEQFIAELDSKPSIRGETIAALIGAVVIVALIAGYLFDRGPVVRWLESHRNVSIAAPVAGQVFRDCPTCPLMMTLPPGQFAQGAAPEDEDATALERPQHPVRIAYPLGIGVYEVTVGEFKEFAAASAHQSAGCSSYDGSWQAKSDLNWNNVGFTQSATHPVACVSWRDATEYAQWLSQKTGQHYRLPSDSEWEFAARAGATQSRPWGAFPAGACSSANVADETAAQQFPGWKVHPCTDGYVYTAPVGSFRPNAFGLYDMLGNVFEWVQDCWHDDYRGAPVNGAAWLDGDCTQRGMRGGSWFTAPSLVSVAARNRFEDTYRSSSVGFRLVREIQQ